MQEYWAIDPGERRVYLWTGPAPGGFASLETWVLGQRAASAALGCTLDVGALFDPYG